MSRLEEALLEGESILAEYPESTRNEDPDEDLPEVLTGLSDGEMELLVRAIERLEAQEMSPASEEVLEQLALHAGDFQRYRIEGELGRGGMGAIFRVWDTVLDRKLAMKVVLGRIEGRSGDTPAVDPRSLQRFLGEAKVTGQLDHPGIVPIHELGLDPEGQVYFTMKLVRGHTLETIFKLAREGAGGWSITRVLGVLQKLCDAMAYAHAKGVIHRDLKPSNVMVGNFGEVYVVDWGLAKVRGRGEERDLRVQVDEHVAEGGPAASPLRTMDGAVLGTPAYMSPEQANGLLEEMGPHTDVYAAGAMLYHLLAGEMPYCGREEQPDARTVWHRVKAGPPRPLGELAPGASPELMAICAKAMSREPLRRYPDMAQLGGDIRAFLEGLVVEAYSSGTLAKVRKWIARNRVQSVLIGSLVLVLVVGPLAFGLREKSHRHRQDLAADTLRVPEFLARSEALWPAVPARIPEMREWLEETSAYDERLVAHLELLAELEDRATGWTSAGGKPEPTFEDPEIASEYERQRALVDRVRLLVPGSELAQEVASRIDRAQALVWDTIESPEARGRWMEAMLSIADPLQCPAYEGLLIGPQLGLLPIRRNPATELWEFWHVVSGVEPRLEEGEFELDHESGMVLILVPGGRPVFDLGPGTRPQARPVAPYFLSAYELTQGQWRRQMASNPSLYPPGYFKDGKHYTLTHPVEMVSWEDGVQFAHRLNLTLPTEAQWVHALRKGLEHSTPTDPLLRDLVASAKIAERRTAGFWAHAPVDSHGADEWGFHHLLGNVAEWCLDEYGSYNSSIPIEARSGQSFCDVPTHLRVARGGDWQVSLQELSTEFRFPRPIGIRSGSIGLRLARGLDRHVDPSGKTTPDGIFVQAKLLDTRWRQLGPARSERIAEYEAWLGGAEEVRLEASRFLHRLPSLQASLQVQTGGSEPALTGAALRMSVIASLAEGDPPAELLVDLWWHQFLENDVAAVAREFAEDATRVSNTTEELAFARSARRASIDDPAAAAGWDGARAAIAADERFAGFDLLPIEGLLPLGPDPASGLQEFAHLQSGEAFRREEGRGGLALREETGIVLVLVPGGSFLMGHHHENGSMEPVHELSLPPFLISKFELTQAQWLRLSGDRPSTVPAPDVDADDARLHPVESLSAFRAERMLARWGLELPTEAAWEYAALGGSAGIEPGNMGEQEPLANIQYASLDDGYAKTAPVGRFPPNPFGLLDVYGNVWERCKDGYGLYEEATFGPYQERYSDLPESRVHRGGCWLNPTIDAWIRGKYEGEIESPYVGYRPFLSLVE